MNLNEACLELRPHCLEVAQLALAKFESGLAPCRFAVQAGQLDLFRRGFAHALAPKIVLRSSQNVPPLAIQRSTTDTQVQRSRVTF